MRKTRQKFALQIRERLELPRAVLSQLQETRLFNDMLANAIDDLDKAIELLSDKAPIPDLKN